MTYGGSKVDRVCTSVNLNSGYGKVGDGIQSLEMKKLAQAFLNLCGLWRHVKKMWKEKTTYLKGRKIE